MPMSINKPWPRGADCSAPQDRSQAQGEEGRGRDSVLSIAHSPAAQLGSETGAPLPPAATGPALPASPCQTCRLHKVGGGKAGSRGRVKMGVIVQAHTRKPGKNVQERENKALSRASI